MFHFYFNTVLKYLLYFDSIVSKEINNTLGCYFIQTDTRYTWVSVFMIVELFLNLRNLTFLIIQTVEMNLIRYL